MEREERSDRFTAIEDRFAGSVQVRKRVRTDREHLEAPTRREEVDVDDETERRNG